MKLAVLRHFFLLAWSCAGLGGTESTTAREEIAELRREVARHDELYHRRAAPEISDADYDRLKRRLAELERAFPEAAREMAAVAEIGDDRSGLFPTARHRTRMLSLDKAYSTEELRAFDARLAKTLGRRDLAYVVEPKFDGIAVSVTYENGELVRAVTRGDGDEGDDITANVRTIDGVPERLRAQGGTRLPIVVEVRGEIYVPFAEFERINAEREAAGETAFANPRNLAAGTVRQREPREVERRGLRVVFYGVGACEPLEALPETQHELSARLQAWGLPAIETSWRVRGLAELESAVEALRKKRRSFSFPSDGAVVKLDALALQRELGAGESAPRWAIAYKFAAERVETQVRAITLQVGRTGVLTPVAALAPVELAGSTVARATLHNREAIARKDVRVGDFVFVEKAGEIIPAVVAVNRARRPAEAVAFVFPKSCPVCEGELAERAGEAAVRCVNRACPEQVRRRVEHFASRGCMSISGLGPATIAALVERGWVKEVSDLYHLRRDQWLALPGIGAKTADRLLAAVEASKRAELWRVVHGLGIPGVGAATAREVAKRCGSLEGLLGYAETAPAGAAVRAHFADERNRAVVVALIAAGWTSPVGDHGPRP